MKERIHILPLSSSQLKAVNRLFGLDLSMTQVGVGLLRYTPPIKAEAKGGPSSGSDPVSKEGKGGVIGDEGRYDILSNPRKTYLTPPGTGFLPRETAWHHQQVGEQVLGEPCNSASVENWLHRIGDPRKKSLDKGVVYEKQTFAACAVQ